MSKFAVRFTLLNVYGVQSRMHSSTVNLANIWAILKQHDAAYYIWKAPRRALSAVSQVKQISPRRSIFFFYRSPKKFAAHVAKSITIQRNGRQNVWIFLDKSREKKVKVISFFFSFEDNYVHWEIDATRLMKFWFEYERTNFAVDWTNWLDFFVASTSNLFSQPKDLFVRIFKQ